MEVLLANLEQAQRRNPRFDHRTTIVHFGFAAEEQVARAGRLGAIVSANPYYVTALAGRYAEVGIGPERSQRMVPLGDAKRAGMSISLHSDMPMAPAKPLQLVWSAVNRMTAEGNVVGADQRLDLDTALKAVTIDAAFSIRLEHEVGSVAPGKWANFTVLEQSPYDVKPEDVKDIKVWGTVLEGRVQQAMGLSAPKKAEAPAAVTKQPSYAQAAPSDSRQPIAFTSSAYRLAASRTGNDLGLCADHTAMVDAFARSILTPERS
jgi:predicted amidohydrolase YtcJ